MRIGNPKALEVVDADEEHPPVKREIPDWLKHNPKVPSAVSAKRRREQVAADPKPFPGETSANAEAGEREVEERVQKKDEDDVPLAASCAGQGKSSSSTVREAPQNRYDVIVRFECNKSTRFGFAVHASDGNGRLPIKKPSIAVALLTQKDCAQVT